MNSCNVPISIGELYDKYSILQIKKEMIQDTNKLLNINKEIEYLQPFVDKFNLDLQYREQIKEINKQLWIIEDRIRIKEKNNEFDEEFISLARAVYKTNDIRHLIKSEINSLNNSIVKDIKSYM